MNIEYKSFGGQDYGIRRKRKKEYRKPWFLILIVILIMTILFDGPAKPFIPGSISWFLILFVFFASLVIGIWLGLRKGRLKE